MNYCDLNSIGLQVENNNGIQSLCKISLYGATVLSWSVNGKERLWLSSLSKFDGTAPIRGGIPLAFPQFADNGPMRLHGFAREMMWTVVNNESGMDENESYNRVTLEVRDNEFSRLTWNYSFILRYRVTLKPSSLHLSFTVMNCDTSEWEFSTCLHTYFKTPDSRQLSLSGLQGLMFVDKVDGRKLKKDPHALLQVEQSSQDSHGYVDRIYHCITSDEQLQLNEPTCLTLTDAGTGAVYHLRHSASFVDTVIFNPWIDGKRGPGHPDFDDDGFNYMICIEPAVAVQCVALGPGGSWTGDCTITVNESDDNL